MHPFRFLIVGSGNISRTYVTALSNVPEGSVVGTVSRSGRRPENAPADLPVFQSIGDASSINFDGVILATPNGTHHLGAKKSAALGKHVLTEKVLDVSRANMDSMIAACSEAGVLLAVSYQRRASPDNIGVKRLIDSGALGRLYAVDVRVKFYRDQAYYDSGPYRGGFEIDGGGPFMQQAAHQLDIYCWFFGLPMRVVSMLGTFGHEIDVEDHGVAVLRHATGMIGTITASTIAYPGYEPILEVHTEKGSFSMANDRITQWDIPTIENPSVADEFVVHSGAGSAAVSDTAGHEAILTDFISAVRNGHAPMVPASSGRLATDLALQIYESEV